MVRPSKNYSSRELQEDYKFIAVLYPDSTSYNCEERLAILQYSWLEFAYILHDKDSMTINDVDNWYQDHSDGECPFNAGDHKKNHIHVVVKSSYPIKLGRAAEVLGIPSNDVQRCKDYKKSLRYLIHLSEPGKFQYSIDEVITNIAKIEKILSKTDSDDKARAIIEYIKLSDCNSLINLCEWASSSNCIDELRRGQHLYISLLKEKKGFSL